ncbi:hypothetical protein SKAU_G00315680 [Synaphobranchus kaupii]|uniref:Uncharacterized protein n=1 Tax=Synaphobranchus kaupii TaxID=118154 RepID=A0A9Q1ESM2_SYNKA|nr:hypothetical protein SKAU_G00315680 [Synaphobranchus kaupii]
MALRHYLWTLLLCDVLIYSICGVQKVGNYEAIQYRSAPRTHTHSNAFRPRSAVKGAGAPYSPSSAQSQPSPSPQNQREEVQHHNEDQVPTVNREQVKLIPVFQGHTGLSVAQPQIIRFGSTQTQSTSRLLSGFNPPHGGSTLGSAVGQGHAQREADQSRTPSVFSHVPFSHSAQAPSAARLPTNTFGSGHSTGTSYSSHYNTASSGPGYTGSARRDHNLPARIPHRPSQSINTANLPTRYSGTHRYPQNLNTASRAIGVHQFGSRAGSSAMGHSGSHVFQPPSRTVQYIPAGFAPFLNWGSTSGFHTITVKPDTGSAGPGRQHSRFHTITVKPDTGSAGPGRQHSHFHTITVKPDTGSAGSVKGGGASMGRRQHSHFHTITVKPDTGSAGSVEGGGASMGRRQHSSLNGAGRPTGTGPDAGYTRRSGSSFDGSTPAAVHFLSAQSGSGRRNYGCLWMGCNPTGHT